MFGVGDLGGGDAAELPDAFNDVVDGVDIGLREVSSCRVDGQFAANLYAATLDEGAALTLGAEAVVLDSEEH